MEDSMSSTNHKNNDYFSIDGLEFSSEDSGWSLYFNNSVSNSNVGNSVTCFSSECSSIFSGAAAAAAAASVEKTNSSDDHVASARPVAKRRKIRADFIDHDLEDTATSPAYNSEVQDMQQLQETSYGLSMLPFMQQGKQDCSSFFQVKQNIANQTGEVTHSGYTMKDISYTGLKEKGLCLVPVSLLFQVW